MTENDFTGAAGEPDLPSGAGGSEFEAEFMLRLIAADFTAGSDEFRLRARINGADMDNYVAASIFEIDVITSSAGRTRRAYLL